MKTNQKNQLRSIFSYSVAVFTLFVLLAVLPTGLQAQWNPNTYVNLQVSGLSDDDQQSIPTTDGKTWIAFYSQTAGNYNMMAQLLDANGNKLLGPDGVVISTQTSGSAIYVFNVCLDASNNLVIACQDQRISTMQAVCYKISQTGAQLWSPTGVILGAGLSPYPATLSTGETVVAWNESTSSTLKIQKISVGGIAEWTTPVSVMVGATKTTRGQLIANTNGKFTNVFQKKGVGVSTTLYSQAYDSTGLALYTPVQISNQTSSGSRYYSILTDADTTYFGYFVSQGSRFNSFLQRINITGVIPWGMNGSNFNTSVASTDAYQMVTDINMTPGTNYIWSVCNFCNTLQSQYGIYVQKFLKTTGGRQFTDQAKVLYPISANFDQHVSRITLLTDGPMFLEYDVNYKIYVIRLNSTGDFVWPGNRAEISSTTATAGTPKMRYSFTPIGANRCAGVWTENRASGGYKGYAQGITIGGLCGIRVATQGNVPAIINVPLGILQMVDTISPATANQSVNWSIRPGTGNATISPSGLVSAVSNGTVWAKAVAVQDNTVSDSLLITMTNQPTLPAVITMAASTVTGYTAVLNGSVNANWASTAVTFNWGLTTAYGNTITATPSTVTGNTVTAVLANLTGLIPGTTYHFRASGTNLVGTTNGADMTFTTQWVPPTVVTNAASNVVSTSAQLNGTVTANYGSTTVSFDWGLTTAYGNNAAALPGTVTGNTATAVNATILNLQWATTYHFRCVGVNAGGTTYGADQVFNTNCPIPPAPGGIIGPTSVCQNQIYVVYQVVAVPNATNYNWTVPAGASIIAGAGTNFITVNFSTTAISGNITITPTNFCSSGPTGILPITVNPMPVPTISGSTAACAQYTNNVYTTQSGMTGYFWTVSPGGVITAGAGTQAVTVTWTTTGSKTVTVNYNNANGCTAANPGTLTVTVNGLPSPTINGASTLCANSGYFTYTTETGMSNYNWTISSAGTITGGQGTSTINVQWNSAGAQTLSVNYSNAGGCQALNPTVLNITVNDIPAAAGAINGTTTVCAGAQGVPYSVASISGAQTYVWTLPAGATIASGAGTNIISVNYAANASSGAITVQGNNLCGSGAASPALNITVTPIPSAAGSISGPTYICQGENGAIYTVPAITNATGYTWTVPSGATITSGANTNTIHVNFSSSASSGIVTVLGSNACGDGASSNLVVTVSPVPATPTITASGYVLTSSAANGNQWYHDGTAVAGATSQTYTVPSSAPGWYWTVVTLGPCSSDSSNHKYIQGVGIGEQNRGEISIYPVPNDGRFNISISSEQEISYKLDIYNSLGVKIYGEQSITAKGTQVTPIDLGSVASGLYTIILRNADNQVIRKILVSR